MDRRYDYLMLRNGGKFQIPFDVMLVFSTNLTPADLADDAFLRRIGYKLFVGELRSTTTAGSCATCARRATSPTPTTAFDLCARLPRALPAAAAGLLPARPGEPDRRLLRLPRPQARVHARHAGLGLAQLLRFAFDGDAAPARHWRTHADQERRHERNERVADAADRLRRRHCGGGFRHPLGAGADAQRGQDRGGRARHRARLAPVARHAAHGGVALEQCSARRIHRAGRARWSRRQDRPSARRAA